MKYFVYCRKSSEAEDRQVQSIESQQRELARLFGTTQESEVAEICTESQSAMTTGRPVFTKMMERIERGEAEGLIAWAPDRLARNAVDGGRVIYLLDTGKLKDLKFATFTFENTPSGKFMLSILFGQSKYYSDALSENVRRGIRTKLENGWMPNMAKIGYRNDPATRTIVPDPERLPLVREIWMLKLAGKSTRHIYDIMKERGLRTVTRKRTGGRPLSLSGIYDVLTNPFYAGVIPWRGRLYPGKHEPIITMNDFEAVQRMLRRPDQSRPKERDFAFTGMIKCGECGFSVTAEEKVNRFGSRYTYYHCSKRRVDYRCRQGVIEVTALERQIHEFLLGLRIAPELERYALEFSEKAEAESKELRAIEASSRQEAIAKNERARRNLTRLRISEQISETEFDAERHELEREYFRLSQSSDQEQLDRFEPEAVTVEFSNRAAEWFSAGDKEIKREIFRIVGSNPTLLDRKLNIKATKLFLPWANSRTILNERGVVNEVRTLADTDPEVRSTLNMMHNLLQKMKSTDDQSRAA